MSDRDNSGEEWFTEEGPGGAIAFRNLKNARLLAMDVGGSLTKIAYYSTLPVLRAVYRQNPSSTSQSPDEDCRSPAGDPTAPSASASANFTEGARLHFVKFETSQIEKCLDFVRLTLSSGSKEDAAVGSSTMPKQVYVTGGGAYKYADLIEERLSLKIVKLDEMECFVAGANFLLSNIADEAFIYEKDRTPPYTFLGSESVQSYPYLLVTIGSGVSIIKVDAESKFERIGGTATGGGTFWGLGRLLTGAKGFDELLELATTGDFRKVDMLVRDIYGDRDNDYGTLGLGPTVIASSFGKAISQQMQQMQQQDHQVSEETVGVDKADIARSLLLMVSNDIGQISSLYAMLHKVKNIFFGGFFLRCHPVGLHTISYAVNFWSKGQVKANFLRHEGYLGAIGAFLKGCEAETTCHTQDYAWVENLYGTNCSFPAVEPRPAFATSPPHHEPVEPADASTLTPLEAKIQVKDYLEIERYETRLGHCPLLADPESYVADTVDLNRDEEAREYWLGCFEESLQKFTERAVQSQLTASIAVGSEPKAEVFGTEKEVKARAHRFSETFLNRIRALRTRPFAHGNLTVRSLLDMREHCLSEFGFHDPYLQQKLVENDAAFQLLPDLLRQLDQMPLEPRQDLLAKGLLAGNVFDWGAKEVALLMENKGGGLKFEDALSFIQPRPWLLDHLDRWKQRLSAPAGPTNPKPAYKCVAVFIDNSGFDVVLGVLPFVRNLLMVGDRQTKVLLCANNRPVLNDVTAAELTLIVERAAAMDPDNLGEALSHRRLLCLNSGQSSACLDLSRLNQALSDQMVEHGVDLIILEGMGRAIHTNLDAGFTCDCLKVAVLKNRWLANRLGGEMFSVVFRFEEVSSP